MYESVLNWDGVDLAEQKDRESILYWTENPLGKNPVCNSRDLKENSAGRKDKSRVVPP